MQATRKTHVIVDSSEFEQRLAAALIQAVGDGVKVLVDASLVDDEDQYRFVAGVTLKTEAQVRQAVVTKVQELLKDVDVRSSCWTGTRSTSTGA